MHSVILLGVILLLSINILAIPALRVQFLRLVVTSVTITGFVSELKIMIKTVSFLKQRTQDSSILTVKGGYVCLCPFQDLEVWLLKSHYHVRELRPYGRLWVPVQVTMTNN